MFTFKKMLFATAFVMTLAFGAAQAADDLKLFRPETDAGRDEVFNQDPVQGSEFPHNAYDYGPVTETRSEALRFARPETDYGRTDVVDQPSMDSVSRGSIEASRPVTDRYSYSEATE